MGSPSGSRARCVRCSGSELRRLAGDLFYAVIAGCPTVTNVSALFRRDAAGRVTTLVHQTSRAGAIAFERSGG